MKKYNLIISDDVDDFLIPSGIIIKTRWISS